MLKFNKNKLKSCLTHISARHVSQLQSSEAGCSTLDAKSIISNQLKCPSKIGKEKKLSKTAVLDKLDQTIGGTPTNDYALLSSPHYQAGSYHNARQNKLEFKKKGTEIAEYVIGKFPDLFKNDFDSDNKSIWIGDVSQPKEIIGLDALKVKHDEANENDSGIDSNASKPDLIKHAIKLGHFDDAVSYYAQLDPEKRTDDITNMLLAHVCFYCGSNMIKKCYGERPFSLYQFQRIKGNFKLVEKMFDLIDNPTNEQYCVFIRCLSKLRLGDKGMDVYRNNIKEDMLLDNDTINCLLHLNRHAKSRVNTYEMAEDLHGRLNKNNLLPNEEMFSSIFFLTVGRLRNYKTDFQYFMNELHACKLFLTPSLFYQIIFIVANNKNEDTEVVNEALDYFMDYFENYENLKCTHPEDTHSFNKLLNLFSKNNDLKRCKRLYEIICNSRVKRDMLKNMENETRFYSTYFSILVKLDTITNVWEAKRSLSPKKFSFTSVHVKQFFDLVAKNKAFEYIPILGIYLLRDRSNNYEASLEVFEFIANNFESIANYNPTLKEKGDTFIQIKNMCIISLKNPSTFMMPSRDVGRNKIINMQEAVCNYSLQFMAQTSDFVSLRRVLENFARFGFTLQPDPLSFCKLAVKKNPRLEDYVKRIESKK